MRHTVLMHDSQGLYFTLSVFWWWDVPHCLAHDASERTQHSPRPRISNRFKHLKAGHAVAGSRDAAAGEAEVSAAAVAVRATLHADAVAVPRQAVVVLQAHASES
jgi:hypothetical protein